MGKAELTKYHQMHALKCTTAGTKIYPVVFYTNIGPIRFYLWIDAGQENNGRMHDGFYNQSGGAMIMFDVTSRIVLTRMSTTGTVISRALVQSV